MDLDKLPAANKKIQADNECTRKKEITRDKNKSKENYLRNIFLIKLESGWSSSSK